MAFVLKYCGNAEESWYTTKKECIEDFARVATTLDAVIQGVCLATIHRGSIRNGAFTVSDKPLFLLFFGNRGGIRCVPNNQEA